MFRAKKVDEMNSLEWDMVKLAVPFTMRMLITIFIVAVLLNYLWELAQAPLYVGLDRYNAAVLWHCFVASVGDGIMLLVITAAGRVTLHRWNWFERPRVFEYLVMLSAGLILAVLVEVVALHLLGRWDYSVTIPTVLGIGVVPIAQMVVLPPLIFRIAVVLGARR